MRGEVAVRAVVFDVGGVFLLPSPEVLRPALAAVGAVVEADELFHRAHFVGTSTLDAIRAGGDLERSGWPEYRLVYAETVLSGDARGHEVLQAVVVALTEEWRRPAIELWSWVQPEAVEALARLVDAGWPVAIVSNADGTVEENLRVHRVCQVGDGEGVSVLHVTDSHLVGVEKPHPGTFAEVLGLMAARGIAAGECLYVGDTRSADVIGAGAAGMQVVQIDPYDLYAGDDHDRARSVTEVVDRLLASVGGVGPGL